MSDANNVLIHGNVFDRADALQLDATPAADTRLGFGYAGKGRVFVCISGCWIESQGPSPLTIRIAENGDTYITLANAMISNHPEAAVTASHRSQQAAQAATVPGIFAGAKYTGSDPTLRTAARIDQEDRYAQTQITCSCGLVFAIFDRADAQEHAKRTGHSVRGLFQPAREDET